MKYEGMGLEELSAEYARTLRARARHEAEYRLDQADVERLERALRREAESQMNHYWRRLENPLSEEEQGEEEQ